MYSQNNKYSLNCIIVVFFFVVSLFLYLLFLVNLLIFDFCKLVYLLSLVNFPDFCKLVYLPFSF